MKNTLSIVYYNTRSHFPKLDDIRAVSVAESPDIICVVETWLSNSLSDYEIVLPGYQYVRCDRDRHGGGVLMYKVEKSFL